MRLGGPVELAGDGGPGLAGQRGVPLADEPLADADDLPLADADGRGDLLIGTTALGMGVVGHEEDPRLPHGGRGHTLPATDGLELLALLGGQHDAHLVDGIGHPFLQNQGSLVPYTIHITIPDNFRQTDQ